MTVRTLAVVLFMLVGLLGGSSVALAEHEESHPEDTWFSFGYDSLDHFLAINIDANDVDECVLASGDLTGIYGAEENGIHEVTLAAPFDICEVSGTVVAGPQGQVNHGQFLKAAKSLFDVRGHGCLVRHLAKSDIGRTDATRVLASDAVPVEIGEGGTFAFSTFEADCSRGKGNGGGNGGRPDSPGKSGEAPGRNK